MRQSLRGFVYPGQVVLTNQFAGRDGQLTDDAVIIRQTEIYWHYAPSGAKEVLNFLLHVRRMKKGALCANDYLDGALAEFALEIAGQRAACGQFIQVEKAGEIQLLQLVAQLERILSAIAAGIGNENIIAKSESKKGPEDNI